MKKAVVFLADGFEECEGLLVVDLLRRAGVEAVTASVTSGLKITGSHRIAVQADALAEAVDFEQADLIVLPGGLPGTTNLSKSQVVREQCVRFAENGKLVAAICAAPSVLAELGLLDGKPATCHPGFESRLAGARLTGESVTTAGNIVTGQGLGAAIPFALELVKLLVDRETAEKIREAICFRQG